MKILVVGAGATGGYIGGRLVEKGEDVTFLVRSNRQNQLKENGLVIKSPFGDTTLQVKSIGYDENAEPYDLIIISVKAYHLDEVIEQLESYLHKETVILPFLNGFEHYEKLTSCFGEKRILPGLCFIYSTLNSNGDIIHTGEFHRYVFGEWNGVKSERIQKIERCFSEANFTSKLSNNMKYEVWNKYAFIASMSGITTLFQSSMGPILDMPIAKEWYSELIKEICDIIQCKADIGYDAIERITNISFGLHREAKSSMLQDMEKCLSIEGDHIHGYLLKNVDNARNAYPRLSAVYSNLAIYEEKRKQNYAYTR